MGLRKINQELLECWLQAHAPEGVSKLALKAKVSSSLLNKMRASSLFPQKRQTRLAIAKAIGVGEDELFPEVKDEIHK